MLPVLLPTDVLLWLVCGLGVAFAVNSYRNKRHARMWSKILQQRRAPFCMAILALYFLIALLDSVHLQSSSSTPPSLLDLCLKALPMQREKSYSAPLAVELLATEREVDSQGNIVRVRPRLQHGGASVQSAGERNPDILKRVVFGGLAGGTLGYLVIVLFRKYRGSQAAGNRSTAFVVTGISVFLGAAVALAAQYHLFGTDKVGIDLLHRGLKGCRTAIVLGAITTLLATPLALALGILAGFQGGVWDDLVQYVYIVAGSIPGVLFIAAGMMVAQANLAGAGSAIQNDSMLLWLCGLLAFAGFPGLCRLIRAESLRMREMGFITTATILGASRWRIVLRHLLPNLFPLVAVSIMLRFSGLVLSEAVLTYVGIGVDPSLESWGAMLNAARFELAREPVIWWNFSTAMLFILGLILPVNILGEIVREALDPALRIQ